MCEHRKLHPDKKAENPSFPPLLLLVRMRSEPDVLIRKNPREVLFTRLSCSYCVQLILALKEGGLGGRRGRRKKGADSGLKQGDSFFNILISHFINFINFKTSPFISDEYAKSTANLCDGWSSPKKIHFFQGFVDSYTFRFKEAMSDWNFVLKKKCVRFVISATTDVVSQTILE